MNKTCWGGAGLPTEPRLQYSEQTQYRNPGSKINLEASGREGTARGALLG